MYQLSGQHLFRNSVRGVMCIVGAMFLMGTSKEVFSQSLNDSLQAAWGNDPSLQSAAANRVAAKENIGIARSRLLPQANIQGSNSNLSQTTTQNTNLGPQANSFKGTSYNYTLSIRQGLIRPRDWVGLDLGRQQAFYGELKFQSAKSDLWNRTANAWIDLLSAQMTKMTYAKAIQTVAESASQEAQRFEKGDGTKDSMIEAQAQLKQAKAMLSDAELNLQSKLKAYKILTGLDSNDWLTRRLPSENRVNFNAFGKDVLWERIDEETPELLAAVAVERINQIKAQQSKYDVYPTLDAYGQSTNAQNDTTNTLGYQYRNNQVGLQLNYPLYAGGGLEATKRQALASYEASVADRESLSIRIQNQFDGDWSAQAGFLEKANAAQALVLAAQEQKKAAEMGIQQGLRTWTDVSNAALLLARRETDLNTVLVNLYKLQSRILSLLPSDDPTWDEWVRQLDLASLEK